MANYNGECNVAIVVDDWMMKHMMKAWFMPDGDEKKAAMMNAVGVEFPKTMALIESRIPAEGFLCGAHLSKWDIAFASFWMNLVRSPQPKSKEMVDGLWAATPANVQAYILRVEEVFKDYLAARPKCSM